MKKVTKKWKMRDGTKIGICDMEDSHLDNTIKMIERICREVHARELTACASISFQGEMACDEQDRFLTYSEWTDYAPDLYEDLLNEQCRRIDQKVEQ